LAVQAIFCQDIDNTDFLIFNHLFNEYMGAGIRKKDRMIPQDRLALSKILTNVISLSSFTAPLPNSEMELTELTAFMGLGKFTKV